MVGALFRLRLADADRERYGCPEWLDIDPFAVTAWEAALIQRGFTRDAIQITFDSPGLWMRSLTGEVVTGVNGEPVMDPVLGGDGEPAVVPRRRPNMGAELILVWLALRHTGINVPMDQVDYHVAGMTWEPIPDDDQPTEAEIPGESEGKDAGAAPSEHENTPTSVS